MVKSNNYDHYPSDKFLHSGDDALGELAGSGSYLMDEGTILTHNYGLFDEINCAGGELWDQADGRRFADMPHVTDMGYDGLVVRSETDAFGRAIDIDANDAAAVWLRQHGSNGL